MTKSWKAIAFGAAFGLAAAAPMLAQSLNPAQPEAAQVEASARTQRAAPDCSRDRAWLEAEERTHGILQWLAREAVEHCEAQHATAEAVAAAVRMAAER